MSAADDFAFLHGLIEKHAERTESKLDGFEERMMSKLEDLETALSTRVNEAEKNIRDVDKRVEKHDGYFKTVFFLLTGGIAVITGFFEQLKGYFNSGSK